MEFANYFFIRALEQGWEILKTRGDATWSKLFPPTIPENEWKRARDLIIRTDIQFRLTYSVGITNENTNVVATSLDGLAPMEGNPLTMDPAAMKESWSIDEGSVSVYIISYNEFLMMTLSNIVRTIIGSFVADGWFIKAGFDIIRRVKTEDLRPETGVMPENVTKYIRHQTWACSMTTELPHIEGPFDWGYKPVFVADNTAVTDSILDPTTGVEYQLGGTFFGGVTPVPNTDKEG